MTHRFPDDLVLMFTPCTKFGMCKFKDKLGVKIGEWIHSKTWKS